MGQMQVLFKHCQKREEERMRFEAVLHGAKFDDDDYCNDADTDPVGSFSPNGYGIYDMAGNVYEWVSDWYGGDYYTNSPAQDPQGPSTGSYRVIRGGFWYSGAQDCRSAYRNDRDPRYSDIRLGFRAVRSAF